MEIRIGDLKLTATGKGTGGGTFIIFLKDGEEVGKLDSQELKIAIEALEKFCWRP